MTRASMWAFADELYKIGQDKQERVYAPGIVAHEAGHARVHEPIPRDMLLQYGRLGTNVIANAIAKRSPDRKAALNALVAGGLVGDALMLGDEYASTLIGLKKLKKDNKLTKNELRHEGARLLSAGVGYAGVPASRATFLNENPEVRKNMLRLIRTGQFASQVPTFTESGPRMSAEEAKELVEAIAPGTDVYASKKPISGGSLYMPRSYTPIGKTLVYLTTRAMGMNSEDSKRISHKGGVVVAPVAPVSNIGLGVAQSVLNSVFGPLPAPPITLPGANIKLVEGKARGK